MESRFCYDSAAILLRFCYDSATILLGFGCDSATIRLRFGYDSATILFRFLQNYSKLQIWGVLSLDEKMKIGPVGAPKGLLVGTNKTSNKGFFAIIVVL